MSRYWKTGFFALAIGLLGLGLSYPLAGVEENLGLGLLFRLRGPRPAPQQVVLLLFDRKTAQNLGLALDPEKWPRSIYARLTERLAQAGASVIAFDLSFTESRDPAGEALFAQSLARAGNAVLCECLIQSTEDFQLLDERRSVQINIQRILPVIAPLGQAAAATAAFPLPRVPGEIKWYWTFKAEAGDAPTLPVAAFQVYALDIYGDLRSLLHHLNPYLAMGLPLEARNLKDASGVVRLIRTARAIIRPYEAGQLILALEDWEAKRGDALTYYHHRMLRALLDMYRDPNRRYLNFYGQRRGLHRIAPEQIMAAEEDDEAGLPDLANKAVFVGVAADFNLDARDGFFSPLSRPYDGDISGVEIAATAFANLLQDEALKPCATLPCGRLIVFAWGCLLGAAGFWLTPLAAFAVIAGAGLAYLGMAAYLFGLTARWFPLFVPLFIQAPAAAIAPLWWRLRETGLERERIRRVFGLYLPARLADQLAQSSADLSRYHEVAYGTCLYTDAESYTALSEKMPPDALNLFMNRYYEAIFEPVRRHEGLVTNLAGDAMLAVWVHKDMDPLHLIQPCLAALEIAQAVQEFNRTAEAILPIRIGVHAGYLSIGNLGAAGHFEYSPVGDTVNTASRIQELNRYLGTQRLISAESLPEGHPFVTRPVGRFVFKGKSKAVDLFEVLALNHLAKAGERELGQRFARGLDAFRQQLWEVAIAAFEETLVRHPDDGPSLFYLGLARQLRTSAPAADWDGTLSGNSLQGVFHRHIITPPV